MGIASSSYPADESPLSLHAAFGGLTRAQTRRAILASPRVAVKRYGARARVYPNACFGPNAPEDNGEPNTRLRRQIWRLWWAPGPTPF